MFWFQIQVSMPLTWVCMIHILSLAKLWVPSVKPLNCDEVSLKTSYLMKHGNTLGHVYSLPSYLLSDTCVVHYFTVQDLIWGLQTSSDALLPLLCNFSLDYTIRKVQKSQEGLELNGIHELMINADGVNLLYENVNTIIKNRSSVRCLLGRWSRS